jgi:hypothetical protein
LEWKVANLAPASAASPSSANSSGKSEAKCRWPGGAKSPAASVLLFDLPTGCRRFDGARQFFLANGGRHFGTRASSEELAAISSGGGGICPSGILHWRRRRCCFVFFPAGLPGFFLLEATGLLGWFWAWLAGQQQLPVGGWMFN